jgi:predicted dehydrogenase
LREGAIGEVRVIRATFGFRAAYDLDRRWLNRDLGGGAILDVGCYPVSMTRLIAGVARGAPFADPVDVKGSGHVGAESRCDEWACAVMKFPGDIVAQCSTALQVNQPADVVAYGTAGFIVVPSPWFGPGREGGTSELIVHREGSEPETVKVDAGWLYAIEADTVADHLESKEAPSPAMGWEDSIGNMRTLDRWRAEIGMTYDTYRGSA